MDSTEKQISSLIREVDELKEYINALEDENASLWFMIEELQKSQTSIGDAVTAYAKGEARGRNTTSPSSQLEMPSEDLFI